MERYRRDERQIRLTREERECFDYYWEILETYGANEGYYADKAKYEIYKLGRKALPCILAEIKLNDRNYILLNAAIELTSYLAEEEDREEIIRLLQEPRLLRNKNDNYISQLLLALNRLNIKVRREDEGDPRLEESAEILMSIYGLTYGGGNETGTLEALAITGSKEAKVFVRKYNRWSSWADDLEKYLRSVHQIPEDYTKIAMDDPDKKYFPYIEVDDSLNDNEINTLARKAVEIVTSLGNFEETAEEAMLLFAFNYLKSHPKMSKDEKRYLYSRLTAMSCEEERYRDGDVPLPSIGLELEIPLVPDRELHRKILDNLGFKTYDESKDLWEVVNAFSYSPGMQARILEELAKMKAVPIAPKRIRERFYKEMQLSLHINLGVPEEIEDDMDGFEDDIDMLIDALVYAFVSPSRLEHRKTKRHSFFVTDDDVEESDKSGEKRLEIKITEFSDATSFRMINESQLLAGAMFAYVKRDCGVEITEKENAMAEVWGRFVKDVKVIKEKYKVSAAMYNRNVEKSVSFAKSGRLRKEMRKIVNKYSSMTRSTVFSEDKKD